MKKLKFYLFVSLIGIITVSCTDHWIDNSFTETDRNFVVSALDYDRFMFSANAAGNNKTQDDSVFNYSSSLLNYITFEQDEFRAIATFRQIPINNSLSLARQARYDSLSSLMVGTAYDTTYINKMVMTLKEMIVLYEYEKENGTDTITKYKAASFINNLQGYLKRAQVIDSLQKL
jgi:predicted outer membrane protein